MSLLIKITPFYSIIIFMLQFLQHHNNDIHYTKIHDYDIICAHHDGFKIQIIILGTELPTSPHAMANY